MKKSSEKIAVLFPENPSVDSNLLTTDLPHSHTKSRIRRPAHFQDVRILIECYRLIINGWWETKDGGPDRTRICDLLRVKQAL